MGNGMGSLPYGGSQLSPRLPKSDVFHMVSAELGFNTTGSFFQLKLLIWRVEISRGCTSVSIPNKWSNVANVKSSTFIPSISSLALLVMKFSSRKYLQSATPFFAKSSGA